MGGNRGKREETGGNSRKQQETQEEMGGNSRKREETQEETGGNRGNVRKL